VNIRHKIYHNKMVTWNVEHVTDVQSYLQHCLNTLNVLKKSSPICFGLWGHQKVLKLVWYRKCHARLVLLVQPCVCLCVRAGVFLGDESSCLYCCVLLWQVAPLYWNLDTWFLMPLQPCLQADVVLLVQEPMIFLWYVHRWMSLKSLQLYHRVRIFRTYASYHGSLCWSVCILHKAETVAAPITVTSILITISVITVITMFL
jgi:hypothetical protein